MLDTSDMDPELARYLNRNYWEQKQEEVGAGASTTATKVAASTTQPSAPVASATETYSTATGRTEEVRVRFGAGYGAEGGHL